MFKILNLFFLVFFINKFIYFVLINYIIFNYIKFDIIIVIINIKFCWFENLV